jgi:GTP-binding protein
MPLFDTILARLPAPSFTKAEPFLMLVSDLSHSDCFGRQAIGKVINGRAHCNDSLVCICDGGAQKKLNVSKLQTYDGINLVEADDARARDPAPSRGRDGRGDAEVGARAENNPHRA